MDLFLSKKNIKYLTSSTLIRGFTKTYCKRPLASTYIKNERHAFLASFWGYMNEQPVRSLIIMSCLCYCIFQAAVFMGFSITSALLGGLIILTTASGLT